MNTIVETLEGLRTAMITADRAMLEKLIADELRFILLCKSSDLIIMEPLITDESV